MNRKTARDTAFLVPALILMILPRFLPSMGGLSTDALTVIGVFFGSLLLWIGVSIDWPSLLTLLALGMTPVFGFSKTFAGAFGNTTVAFLLLTFMLVYPLSRTNFIRRCTVAFITNRFARRGPWHFVCFLLAAVTFMGLFVSPSVLFVAFMPFLEDIYAVLHIRKGGKTGNMLMMGCAICISLSSGMTAIGHVWPTLAMGYYAAASGREISQFQYMLMGIPTGILLEALLILGFRFLYRPDDIRDVDPQQAMQLRGSVPPADRKEKIVLAVMGLTVLLWVGPGLLKGPLPNVYSLINGWATAPPPNVDSLINGWSTAMPPLLGCVLLFVLRAEGEPILNFREASSKGILWGSVLMTGAATYLGSCLTNADIGISTWLTDTLSPLTTHLPVSGMIFFFMLWAIAETNFSSNIVTTTVVSSVALSVLGALPAGSVHVGAAVSMVGFAAAICSMTPAGQSTINTVAIGSGWTDTRSMFLWGGYIALLAVPVLSFMTYPFASLFM